MNTETAIVEHTPQSAVPVTQIGEDLLLTAENSCDLAQCQSALIKWCDRKIAAEQVAADELLAAWQEAKERKWKYTTLQRHATLAVKRLDFYRKIKSALEHGYAIVPTFPVDLFAIRSSRSNPLPKYYTSGWRNGSLHKQKAEIMPVGEGKYQNPFPLIGHTTDTVRDEKGNQKTQHTTWADAWDDFEFPINMARPQIIAATTRAMAIQVFDELGCLPGPNKKVADPMIFGRILDPRDAFRNRAVSFIIAWHLDTRTL